MSSNVQTSFRGGEWSPYAQGRAELEPYRTAMNVCVNGIPIEQGAWIRRPGTLYAATTRNGVAGVLRSFHFTQGSPYTIEFTPGWMRFFAGYSLVTEPPVGVTAMNTADPAQIITAAAVTWLTNDEIILNTPTGIMPVGAFPVFHRVWKVTKIDTTHFTLSDPITGAGLDGSTITGGGGLQAARVTSIATPYTNVNLQSIRLVQGNSGNGTTPIALLLQPSVVPGSLTAGNLNTAGFQTFTYNNNVPFYDGPYFDPPSAADGSFLVPTMVSPLHWTFAASALTWINSGQGFLSTDVGRLIRIFSEPPLWAKATNYAIGALVKYQDTYWEAQSAGSGNTPGAAVAGAVTPQWWPDPTAAAFTWGTITAVNSTSNISVTLQAADPNLVYAGGDLQNGTDNVYIWQLGLFSQTTGYPAGGCFAGGRFYTYGSVPNRFDGSYANSSIGPLDYSPTDIYGNVTDAHAVDEVAEADDANPIFWMVPINNGIAVGTQDGEFHLTDGENGSSITPTSIICKRKTKYKSANIEARWTGMALAFVQSFQRNVMEYTSDIYGQKLNGFNLSEYSRHMTSPLLEELAYQYELNPTIWARLGDGNFIGCSYKRNSIPFGYQPPDYYGWARHKLGSKRSVLSIQAGPAPDGINDTLGMLTQDPSTAICYVEFLTKNFDENDTELTAYFLDAGGAPSGAAYIPGPPAVIRLYGLQYIAGKTISVWAAGLDLGDFTVSASGTIDLPVDVAGSLFTTALLESLTVAGTTYGIFGTNVASQPGFNAQFSTTLPPALTSSSSALGNRFIIDWLNKIGYLTDAGNGIITYDLSQSPPVILHNATIANVNNSPTIMNANGDILWVENGANQNPVHKVSSNKGNPFLAATMGTPGGGLISNQNGLIASGAIGTVFAAGSNYMVSATEGGLNGTQLELSLVNTDTMTWAGNSDHVELAGYQMQMTAKGFTDGQQAGHLFAIASAASTGTGAGLNVYRIDVTPNFVPLSANISMTLLHAYTAAQIDATWTSVDSSFGVAVDQDDGNLLVTVATSTGSPTNTNYMMKLSAATGQIMWQQGNFGCLDQTTFEQSLVRGGHFDFIQNAEGINMSTVDGSINNQLNTTHSFGGGVSDGATGTIFAQGSGQSWYPFYGSGGAAATPKGNYFAPFAAGFTYTSKGQLLRAIDPQAAGSHSGPALGQNRRLHQYSALLANTGQGPDPNGVQSFMCGTAFPCPWPVKLTLADNVTPMPQNQLYQGVQHDTVEDNNSYDGMFAWSVTRPYPVNIMSIQTHLATKET